MNRRIFKFISIVLIVLVMAGSMSVSHFALATMGTFRTTGSVNLRSEPSTNSGLVRAVDSGTEVEVLDHNPAGWSRVTVGGSAGFIRSDFLRFQIGDTSATFQTTGGVNVRESASTESRVVSTVSAGASVEVTEHNPAGWSRVTINGTAGFIRSDFLTRGRSTEATEPTASATTANTLKTTGNVNLRTAASTNGNIIRTLVANTSVEVLENQSNGWSRVRFNNLTGFIRTDLLSSAGSSRSSSDTAIGTLRTVTGVNLRAGPSTNDSIIRLLAVNTSVDVLENQSNGWSRVRHNDTIGFIRSDLLSSSSSTRTVELIDWSTARNIIPLGVNLRVVDVRTGITFTMRGLAKTGHVDVEPVTQDDTDAIFKSRNGVWSWSARPVWVTVGDRTFAAAMNGMPHDTSTIENNGMNGHLCLHFHNTVTNSQSYQRDLRGAVMEAFNARQ